MKINQLTDEKWKMRLTRQAKRIVCARQKDSAVGRSAVAAPPARRPGTLREGGATSKLTIALGRIGRGAAAVAQSVWAQSKQGEGSGWCGGSSVDCRSRRVFLSSAVKQNGRLSRSGSGWHGSIMARRAWVEVESIKHEKDGRQTI
mmetsp:Transcript_34033/g.81471  ORF Transcript_34033/g.81471 Transcript_34033/m.81471 type:complete len:146 (+) Transcript_34033:59-496(+)